MSSFERPARNIRRLPVPRMEKQLIIKVVETQAFSRLRNKALPSGGIRRIHHEQEMTESVVLGEELIAFLPGGPDECRALLAITVTDQLTALKTLFRNLSS